MPFFRSVLGGFLRNKLQIKRAASLMLALPFLLSCHSKPRGPLAYVSNERDGTITVIDTSRDVVVSTINIGGRLRGIRLSPDKNRIWVAISYPTNQAQGEDTIAELDAQGRVIAKFAAG